MNVLDRPPCRRCLLEDMMDENKLYATVREYIEAIPQQVKTPPELYAKRLDTCRRCADLQNGMCRLCGCFVEMRAAKTANYCPGTPPHWPET
ncbi:MAG: DUF6171 family protein [Oscillospiraceae bacterium]|jgi:hypothetical protein|nr:DUF6171 family protein [Oscillospiraceae bacterium]